MRSKYKKRDIVVDPNKNSSIIDNNIIFTSGINVKRAKSPINGNIIQTNIKPVLNRFNRQHVQQKEKENKFVKEEPQNNKELQIKKLSQTNEKEQKHKNIYKFTRYNINLNSFISSDGNNLNDTNRRHINNDRDKEKEFQEKNSNKTNLEKSANNNNNIKISNVHISKLISYNSKVKNLNKYIKRPDEKNKLKEEENTKKLEDNNKNEKNNIENNNNEEFLNMKSIVIKRKYNYSKLIDKIKKNNNLIQANKNKNKFLSKDNLNNQETNNNDNDNNNNNQDKNQQTKNIKDENEPKIKVKNTIHKNKTDITIEPSPERIEKNIKDNISEASSFIQNKILNWNIKPKQSFQYLVHQVSKSRVLSNSFHKYYESNKLRSNYPSQAASEKDDYSINSNTEEQSEEKHKFRNLSLLRSYKFNEGDSFSSLNTNMNENKYNSLTDRKFESKIYNKSDFNNIKIINFSYNKNQNDNNNTDNCENNDNNNIVNKSSVITNNIINNNVYNTTLNFYKINNICKSKINFQKSKALSSKNLINDEIIYEDETNMENINNNRNNLNNNIITNNNINENIINNNYQPNQKEYSNFTVISSSTNSSAYLPVVNLELIYSLEKILQILLNKINKYQICDKECLNYIMYFFENRLYNEEIKIFKNKHNKNNFLYNIKIEILCFFLCYDISFSKNFNQAAILLKTIFNIIHSNFLIYIQYVIYLYQLNTNIDENNYKLLNKLQIIIEADLKVHLIKQDMNEFSILQIITNNSKNLNNYYKMLIDNLYGQNYISDDNTIKFPQCIDNKNNILLQNKIQNIVSAFFFDAYRLLTNYNFNDLMEFFNIFLNKKQYENEMFNEQNKNTYGNDNDYNAYNNNNIIIQKNNNSKNKIVKYLLPKIKKYYKYSLVLDLDETLICIKRDSNNNVKLNKNNLIALIPRPGLIDFLHKMKQIYELILFSSGTSEYVSPIVKNIEKKEKYFEHILYRQHVTYDDSGNFFKNLNILNRNVKNILIVDDTCKNFKYHKLNGISIKPFYGDIYNDKNTLRILGSILYKIRYDADVTGDIRVSLNKEKNSKLYSQIANNL